MIGPTKGKQATNVESPIITGSAIRRRASWKVQ